MFLTWTLVNYANSIIGVVTVERVAVFIDNGYFKKVQVEMNERVGYQIFSDEIVGASCIRFRTYVYDCEPYQSTPATTNEIKIKSGSDSFKHSITNLPKFEFRSGRLQKVRNDEGSVITKKDGTPLFRQKGIDMALGVDLVRLSATKQIQKAILVAGDSDFVPAIKVAKEEGVSIILYYSPS